MKRIRLVKKGFYLFIIIILAMGFASCELARQLLDNYYEVSGPLVSLGKPTNDQKVGTNFVVSGSAYDLRGVSEMTLYYCKTNQAITNKLGLDIIPDELVVFYTKLNVLEQGIYAVWVSAKNKMGGETIDDAVYIEVGVDTSEDLTPPVVGITSPTNGQIVSSVYTISGTVSDEGSGVKNVYVKTDNGSYLQGQVQNNNWSMSINLDTPGIHTNLVYAVDYAGNSSIPQKVVVEYQAGLPWVVIISPAPYHYTGTVTNHVVGTAGADGGINLLDVAVSVNGGAYETANGTQSWSKDVALSPGTNSITARVITYFYVTNFTSEPRMVIYDNTRPTLIISSPKSGASITNTEVNISGTASDTFSGLEGIYLSVDGGAFSKVDTSPNWSAKIALGVGTHSFAVYAKDMVGNMSDTNSLTDITIVDPDQFFSVYFFSPDYPPNIWWWEGGPGDDCGTNTNDGAQWPGTPMNDDGYGWYKWTFLGTQTHLIFNTYNYNGFQTPDLVRNKDGWYSNNQWYDIDPRGPRPPSVWASPGGGQFVDSRTITLNLTGDDITLSRYTLDGSDPANGGTSFTNGQKLTIGSEMVIGDQKVLRMYATSPHGSDAVSYTFTKVSNITIDFSWDNVTVYFVITDRFYNGNTANDRSYGRDPNGGDDGGQNIGTFHGGDLAGLTAKLNEGYFTDLGVTAIWITAPYEQIHGWVQGGSSADFKHYAYHGYYVLDYTTLDQNMGTTNELREFVDTAHSNGIRVIFDVVLNHCGYPNVADLSNFVVSPSDYLDSGSGVLKPGVENVQLNNLHSYINYNSWNWTNWWGPDWIRAGFPGHDAPGSDDLTMSLAFLPDFKTESTAYVGLPPVLQHKPDTRAVALPNYTVRMYLVKWLTDWVREYGIDGFRCDTAKHVDLDTWAYLKQQGLQALADWKAANPVKKLDDLPFWMTAEVWGHGPNKSTYHTSGGFDSVINFGFQGAIQNGLSDYSGIDSTYSSYASSINSDPTFNVLSYISSHDTSLFYNGDADRQKRAGSLLLLAPGGVQIYYGDENCRTFGPTGSDPDQGLRSDMPWPGNTTVLAHWQKIGQFRKAHIAIGAGQHAKIANTPYTFSRYYNKDGVEDKVIIVLGAVGSTTVNVSSMFAEGTVLRDFYSGATNIVSGGQVTFSAQGETLLIEQVN